MNVKDFLTKMNFIDDIWSNQIYLFSEIKYL